MNGGSTFRMRLISPVKSDEIDGVVSFTARDASGSFGILAHAFRRLTALSFGVASFRVSGGTMGYLALPGGVLYFSENVLKIATTSFVRSSNFNEIADALEKKMRAEEEGIHEIKRSLHQLDEEIVKRLAQFSRGRAP